MSTFSSFAYGAVSELMKPGGLMISIVYMFSSLICGFIAVWLGLQMAKEIKN
jgi:CrcB protein